MIPYEWEPDMEGNLHPTSDVFAIYARANKCFEPQEMEIVSGPDGWSLKECSINGSVEPPEEKTGYYRLHFEWPSVFVLDTFSRVPITIQGTFRCGDLVMENKVQVFLCDATLMPKTVLNMRRLTPLNCWHRSYENDAKEARPGQEDEDIQLKVFRDKGSFRLGNRFSFSEAVDFCESLWNVGYDDRLERYVQLLTTIAHAEIDESWCAKDRMRCWSELAKMQRVQNDLEGALESTRQAMIAAIQCQSAELQTSLSEDFPPHEYYYRYRYLVSLVEVGKIEEAIHQRKEIDEMFLRPEMEKRKPYVERKWKPREALRLDMFLSGWMRIPAEYGVHS